MNRQYARSDDAVFGDGSPDGDHSESLAYYGGLRGQYLQQTDTSKPSHLIGATVGDAGKTPLPNLGEQQTSEFNKIQLAAARLVAIQERAKQKGSFSAEDNRIYAASLLELGQAAQNLAKLQQSGQIKDFSVLLQASQPVTQSQANLPAPTPPPEHLPTNDMNHVNGNPMNMQHEDKVEEATEPHLVHDEIVPAAIPDPYEDINDTVAIIPPKKDAAVAEAKPIGVSIAGVGGVASSKPNAIALSGHNGLAVSSPKATAIAGVSPDNVAAYNIIFPSRSPLVIKTPLQSSSLTNTDYYDLIDTPPASYIHHPSRRQANDIRTSNAAAAITAANSIDTILKAWQDSIDTE